VKRATTLHTDIVMRAGRADVAGAPAAAVREATTRRVIDGEDGGWDAHPIHWELARYALDGVHPKPSDDALVAAWYHATSAYLIFRREYGYLTLHVLKGRELRPDDARLQFYSGVLHESYAGPQVQAALSLLTSGSFRPEVRSSVDELKQAEGFFRRALTLDSAMVHARVHLGRVIGLLGRHDEARTELTTALSSLSDRRQRYYAELFLGDTERRAGRGGEARAAYLRASELFPNAQAPRFGLSQVAWDEGDRSAAQESFRTMATLSQDDAKRDDPWWSYEVSSVLDVAELVDNLRRLAVEQLSR
jgi:tetratricopeptide (TPR) repeat protein